MCTRLRWQHECSEYDLWVRCWLDSSCCKCCMRKLHLAPCALTWCVGGNRWKRFRIKLDSPEVKGNLPNRCIDFPTKLAYHFSFTFRSFDLLSVENVFISLKLVFVEHLVHRKGMKGGKSLRKLKFLKSSLASIEKSLPADKSRNLCSQLSRDYIWICAFWTPPAFPW